MKLELRSFTDPGTYYQVDTTGTCSCPAFQADGWCKHLEAVGQYRPRRVTLSARPSYSQALSAVVKSLRIRNPEVGAYWLKYCWGFNEKLAGAQFRTVRRLLIGSAEDGHSVAVMERVSDNFAALLKKDVQFLAVLAELLRICKISNWWDANTGGHGYIYSGMIASRRNLYDPTKYDLAHCLTGISEGIEQQDRVSALQWMMKAGDAGKDVWITVAHLLNVIAKARGHEPAQRLMRNIHIRHAKALTNDNNFIGQAAWLLAGGVSPVIDQTEHVTDEEVQAMLERVNATLPHVIPGFCCDGVHCPGNDIRYCGMWDRMFAVCQQFNHYGRVNPDDPWLEQFYSLEGLDVRQLDQAG